MELHQELLTGEVVAVQAGITLSARPGQTQPETARSVRALEVEAVVWALLVLPLVELVELVEPLV